MALQNSIQRLIGGGLGPSAQPGAGVGAPPAGRPMGPPPANPDAAAPAYDVAHDPAWKGLVDPNDHAFRNFLNGLDANDRQMLRMKLSQTRPGSVPPGVPPDKQQGLGIVPAAPPAGLGPV